MKASGIICATVLLTACGQSTDKVPSGDPGSAPIRIVSLDYCADQYVLALAERDQILALSTESQDDYSYYKEEAVGIRQVRPRAEEVLALKPDLIVRSFGGGPRSTRLYNSAGIPVVQIGWTSDFASVRDVLTEVAKPLHAEARAEIIIADFDERIAALPDASSGQSALYMTPGGVTSGTGTLIDQMFTAAGLSNFETQPGWHDLPLERLVHDKPDVVAAAFYQSIHKTPGAWSPARHPIAQNTLESQNTIPLEGAWTACGAWYLIDAVEALADGGVAP